VLYIHGSVYSSIQTLYKYSFADSSITMIDDSLSTSFDNMTLSPDWTASCLFPSNRR
jgi:hypothetical protein